MNILVRLLLIAFIVCIITPAAAGNECQTMKRARAETAIQQKALGGEIFDLVGKQATDYLAVVNATPPATHLAAPAIMVFAVPKRGAVIGLVFGDSVCVAGRVGAAVHDRALIAAIGEPT